MDKFSKNSFIISKIPIKTERITVLGNFQKMKDKIDFYWKKNEELTDDIEGIENYYKKKRLKEGSSNNLNDKNSNRMEINPKISRKGFKNKSEFFLKFNKTSVSFDKKTNTNYDAAEKAKLIQALFQIHEDEKFESENKHNKIIFYNAKNLKEIGKLHEKLKKRRKTKNAQSLFGSRIKYDEDSIVFEEKKNRVSKEIKSFSHIKRNTFDFSTRPSKLIKNDFSQNKINRFSRLLSNQEVASNFKSQFDPSSSQSLLGRIVSKKSNIRTDINISSNYISNFNRKSNEILTNNSENSEIKEKIVKTDFFRKTNNLKSNSIKILIRKDKLNTEFDKTNFELKKLSKNIKSNFNIIDSEREEKNISEAQLILRKKNISIPMLSSKLKIREKILNESRRFD